MKSKFVNYKVWILRFRSKNWLP